MRNPFVSIIAAAVAINGSVISMVLALFLVSCYKSDSEVRVEAVEPKYKYEVVQFAYNGMKVFSFKTNIAYHEHGCVRYENNKGQMHEISGGIIHIIRIDQVES